MAVEIVKTKYTDSEVSKTSDFQHTADSPVDILQSLFDGAFDSAYHTSGLVEDPETDGVNGTPRTSSVTRGKRIGVNYIIKA